MPEMYVKNMQILGYDERDAQLQVVLPDGNRTDYFDIPRSMYEDLTASESPIEYFNANIWNKKFEHRTYWRSLEALLKYLEENFYFDPPTVTITSRAADDDTPMHFACIWGDLGAVELLLEAGADPDPPEALDCTPLYFAVSFGFVRCAARLLQSGASPDAYNELNTTPRKRALESGNPKMIALFPIKP
jgi:ankyrin repeat protein